MKSTAVDQTFGIIGGLGSLAGADLLLNLVKTQPILADLDKYHFLFEQHPFKDLDIPLKQNINLTSRKLYVYKLCSSFADKGVDKVLLPCFASHTFRKELQAELAIPILDMMEAIKCHVVSTPQKKRLAVVSTEFVRFSGLFEEYFGEDFELIYPNEKGQNLVMEAVYGVNGIKSGSVTGRPLELIHQVCIDLQRMGADLILPGITEIALLADELHRRGINILDSNEIYAKFATTSNAKATNPFKLGIVGGVGPAATVDFMSKVINNTPAERDQDHIKMVVEQNPQIPDRTGNLINHETDPTIALYATCKTLECEGADAIAIPCNTAHAFVERIQPHLNVPIVNMLTETISYIVNTYGTDQSIGLLATSGTIASRVYHRAAEHFGVDLVCPDPDYQLKVMASIYGEKGVKAGFTNGKCVEDVTAAIENLVDQAVSIVLLGCTELPLMFPNQEVIIVGANKLSLIDPTMILAKKCISLALEYPLPDSGFSF